MLIFAQNLRTPNGSKCHTIYKVHFSSCLCMYSCSSQLH